MNRILRKQVTDLNTMHAALANAQVVRRGPFGGVKVVLTLNVNGNDKTIKVTRNALTKLTVQLAQNDNTDLDKVVKNLKRIDFDVNLLLLGKAQKFHDRFFGKNVAKREALLRGACADAGLAYADIHVFPRPDSAESHEPTVESRTSKREKSSSSESTHPSKKKSRTSGTDGMGTRKPSSSHEEPAQRPSLFGSEDEAGEDVIAKLLEKAKAERKAKAEEQAKADEQAKALFEESKKFWGTQEQEPNYDLSTSLPKPETKPAPAEKPGIISRLFGTKEVFDGALSNFDM